VRLGLRLATLEDPMKQLGSVFQIQSGKVYRQIFTGGEEAAAVVELVNSSITQNTADNMIVWSTQAVHYSATVELRHHGQVRLLHSSATGNTAWATDRAAREAVELVAIDLAKQVIVCMR
jgi:hypothetical protein